MTQVTSFTRVGSTFVLCNKRGLIAFGYSDRKGIVLSCPRPANDR